MVYWLATVWYGFPPADGATMAQVQARYGLPSDAHTWPDGTTPWFYDPGRLADYSQAGITFDAAGRVESSFVYHGPFLPRRSSAGP
jgi:hypothetical protein